MYNYIIITTTTALFPLIFYKVSKLLSSTIIKLNSSTIDKPGLLVGRGKKSQISLDFQGQIREKNGRFRGNFAEIFEVSFAEKRLVKNSQFRGSFPTKFRWKAIGFALI